MAECMDVVAALRAAAGELAQKSAILLRVAAKIERADLGAAELMEIMDALADSPPAGIDGALSPQLAALVETMRGRRGGEVVPFGRR